MRAKFEFVYSGKGNVEVEVEVESEIKFDHDKKNLIEAIAGILGIEVEVTPTLAESLWEQDNENKDN